MRVFAELMRRAFRSDARAARDAAQVVTTAREILGEQRLVAVDVGAAMGLLPHWESLDGIATIYQVEPRADACRDLETQNARRKHTKMYHVVEAALAEHSGTATLYVSNAPTGTSLLKPDPASSRDCSDYVDLTYLYPLNEQKIGVESLTTLMDRLDERQLDLIKLDVQGSELPILRGLDVSRRNGLLGVEIEIGLHDFYPDQHGFGDAVRLLETQGLELFDVRVARIHRPFQNDHGYYQRQIFSVYANSPTISARIWEFDAIFFRRKSAILAQRDPAQVRRMILVYCTYNFFSEAYSLVEKAEAAAILPADQAARLKSAIVELHRVRHARTWLADAPQMERWRRLMYRVAPRSAPRWCQYMYQSYPNG
jgi:FkbM family methyltransferase